MRRKEFYFKAERKRGENIPSKVSLTFSFEGKVAVIAVVRTDIGVCANVLPQHAGLLATYSTFLTDILPSPSPSHIHIVFV